MVKKTQLPDHIIDAALALAGEMGWHRVSLADIAQRAEVPLPELHAHFGTKQAIIDAFLDRIDRHMISGEYEAGAVAKDRLFDVLMRRFEAMAPHRAGVRALLRDFGGGDPRALFCGAQHFGRAMALALEAAGLSSTGLAGAARVQGIGAVYLYALRAWLRDESPDMAHTMKALDSALRQADMVASSFTTRPSAAARPDGGEEPSPSV